MKEAFKGITICTTKAGLAAGTTTTYTTASAVAGSINGTYATALSAQSNTATPTTDFNGDAFTALAASEGCIFVYSIVAAGTIAIHQGPVETLDAANNFEILPEFPSIDLDTYVPFGFATFKNGSTGSAWTFGASNNDATGMVDLYTDISTYPPVRRPV